MSGCTDEVTISSSKLIAVKIDGSHEVWQHCSRSVKSLLATFLFSGKDFLIEAFKYHLLKGEQKISFRTPRTKPRQPVGLPKVS